MPVIVNVIMADNVKVNRREFLKSNTLALTAGLSSPMAAEAMDLSASDNEILWRKALCRFCGTGCGLLMGTWEGKVVGTYGDTCERLLDQTHSDLLVLNQ